MLTLRHWGHDAVAVVGADLKREHAKRLAGLARPLVLVPNNDPAGHAAAERWQEAIPSENSPKILHLPSEIGGTLIKDVNELAGVREGQTIFTDLARRVPPTGR